MASVPAPLVDLSPLLVGASRLEIRIAGVAVGDPVEDVDQAALTSAVEPSGTLR